MKKILVVDDSALMRRMMCDIIESDERFQVADKATNGLEVLDFITKNTYDAVVLDVNMPKMTGLQLLEELQKRKIQAKVIMASTDTAEGAKVTLDALELGAIDFVHKPENAFALKEDSFRKKLLRILEAVCDSRACNFGRTPSPDEAKTTRKVVELAKKHSDSSGGSKIIALASSTGGPKALHSVIPMLPKNLKCPMVLVQHMPAGFTKSLAERLDSLSEVKVSEAVDGEVLEAGHVYVACGGKHMNVDMKAGGKYVIRYSDEPSREGVKPCANYMYESLINSKYDEIICVVMTGMGADGTKGIKNLKEKKKVHVIAQEQSTCAVYGMPRSVVNAGLADQIVPLEQIAQEIILNAGVK